MSPHCFDKLVSFTVLQFIHHSDWAINQPFLICKTFDSVFKSDGFTRDFLKRHLLVNNLDPLEKTIQLMKPNTTEKKKMIRIKNPKKRKYNHDEQDSEPEVTQEMPQNLRDVLQIYVKYSWNGDESIVKTKINSLMEEFEKSRNLKLLDSVTKLVKNLKSSIMIRDAYETLLEGERTVPLRIGRNHEIPSDYFSKLFAKLKGVFVLGKKETKYSNTEICVNQVVIFTNCGYPLFINTYYSEELDPEHDDVYQEHVSVYSTELFNHFKRSNQHGYFDTEFLHSTSKLLRIVQDFIFTHDISDTLRKEFNNYSQQSVKEALIYAFFQVAFGEKCNAFSSNTGAGEWTPFRSVDDDYSMVDDEE